jgi:hypothetical protein
MTIGAGPGLRQLPIDKPSRMQCVRAIGVLDCRKMAGSAVTSEPKSGFREALLQHRQAVMAPKRFFFEY